MQTFSVHEAKTHLSRLLAMVERGEEVIVTKSGKPVAKLMQFEDELPSVHHSMMQSVTFHGDVVGPFHDAWDS